MCENTRGRKVNALNSGFSPAKSLHKLARDTDLVKEYQNFFCGGDTFGWGPLCTLPLRGRVGDISHFPSQAKQPETPVSTC